MRLMHQGLHGAPGSDLWLQRTRPLFSFKLIIHNVIKCSFCTCMGCNVCVMCHAIMQKEPALKLLD